MTITARTELAALSSRIGKKKALLIASLPACVPQEAVNKIVSCVEAAHPFLPHREDLAKIADLITDKEVNETGKRIVVTRKVIAQLFKYSPGHVSRTFTAARKIHQEEKGKTVVVGGVKYYFTNDTKAEKIAA